MGRPLYAQPWPGVSSARRTDGPPSPTADPREQRESGRNAVSFQSKKLRQGAGNQAGRAPLARTKEATTETDFKKHHI